jgi:hypothetical protein
LPPYTRNCHARRPVSRTTSNASMSNVTPVASSLSYGHATPSTLPLGSRSASPKTIVW